MERISSNWTLFYKFFLPTFWITFAGAITAAALLTDYAYVGNMQRGVFQMLVLLIFASGFATFFFTFMRLKRVELGPDSVYVTNYFQHYRYSYANVARLEIWRFLLLQPATLHFHQAGKFGPRITFLAHTGRLKAFMREHPEVRARLHVEGLSKGS